MQLVFNWHLTQRCNYSCDYCFAQWTCREEVWNDPIQTSAFLSELTSWKKLKIFEWVQQGYPDSNCRLNFVGGEPLLLGKRLVEIVRQAVDQYEFKASLITNGSLLEKYIDVVDHLEVLGISVDSFSDNVNQRIGRCSRAGKVLSKKQLAHLVALVRERNPLVKIKINTVVSRHNWNEKLIPDFSAFDPDKIKIFRQLPFEGQDGISDQKFQEFLKNNRSPNLNIFVEDNLDMEESYLMVDPSGRFFQNSNNRTYTFSDVIHDEGLQVAFSQIGFSSERYLNRYAG